MAGLERVCVFSGSSVGGRGSYRHATEALGAELGRRRLTVVYGGGGVGLMGVLADAVMGAGGEVVGVIPQSLFRAEAEHTRVGTMHRVDTMHERKSLMYGMADAFVALPGGLGTLEELAETLTWRQIGLHDKPVAALDTDGFYQPFVGLLDHLVAEGFVKGRNVDHLVVDDDPVRLLDRLAALAPAGDVAAP